MFINITNGTKIYKVGYQSVKALDNISLCISKGEFLAIMGPSGSGKSTLMNIIGCLDNLTDGTYNLNGENVVNLPDSQLARIRNNEFGFVFQAFNLLPKLTAFRNVEVPLIYKGIPKKDRREISEKVLTDVGLKDRLHHKPSQLSGGEQQRVAIARAMAANPNVILADEPTGNLDSHSSKEIIDLFISLNDRGMNLVLVTHNKSIAKLAKRSIYMFDGKIVQDEYS